MEGSTLNQVVCLKVGLSPSQKNCFICFNESPLKMIKNAFLFHLKNSFCSQLIGHIEKNDLIRNKRLILKFMTSQTG